MSFLDKAKAKAAVLAGTVKDKVDDFKDGRKVEDLLADLGRITYRQHTGETDAGDAAAIDQLVDDLKKLEAEGAVIVKAPDPEADTDAEAKPSPMAPPAGDGTPMPPPPPAP
jgi:hypothetical protein